MSFILSTGVIVPPLTAGGVAYGVGAQAFVNPAGTTGQVLTSAGAGIPTWSTPAASSFSAGSTGFTPSSPTSGAVTLSGTLAASNGGTGLTSPGSTGNILTSNGTAWTSATPAAAGGITLGTPVATTSGTSFTFTGIPSSAKTIYVNFKDVYAGAAGSADWLYVQIGTSGGISTTGYDTRSVICQPGQSTQLSSVSNAFGAYTAFSNNGISGIFIINLENLSSNRWVSTCNMVAAGNIMISTGFKTLSGTLTQLQIFVNNNYAFSQGEINISYGT